MQHSMYCITGMQNEGLVKPISFFTNSLLSCIATIMFIQPQALHKTRSSMLLRDGYFHIITPRSACAAARGKVIHRGVHLLYICDQKKFPRILTFEAQLQNLILANSSNAAGDLLRGFHKPANSYYTPITDTPPIN